MDSDRTGGPQAHQRLTVAQAAAAFGITEGAVRSRIKRGTLRTTKEAGRLYVLWGGGTAQANQAPNIGAPADHTEELITTLREQLAAERAAHAEARRLLAAALERIPAIEAPSDERERPETPVEHPEGEEVWLDAEGREAQPQEPSESPKMHMPEAGGGALPHDQQTPSSRRSWWRRMFGG